MPPVPLSDAALAVAASARLIRAVTTDEIGDRYLVRPAKRWAGDDPDRQFWSDALECPFCIGMWIGFGVLASYAVARHTGPSTHRAWRFVATGLALNYVVGHVSSRID